MTHPQPPITGTTHILPFDKLSPYDLERLCLWLVECEGYTRAEHLGSAGSEQGRDDLHPAIAEAIAEFASETDAEVLRGALRYPSESGGWQLGDIDCAKYLAKYRHHKMVIVIASQSRDRDFRPENRLKICLFLAFFSPIFDTRAV